MPGEKSLVSVLHLLQEEQQYNLLLLEEHRLQTGRHLAEHPFKDVVSVMVAMVSVLSWVLSPPWLSDMEDDGSLLAGPPQALNTMQRQSTAEIRESNFFFMTMFLSLDIIYLDSVRTASRTNTPWFNSRIRLDMRYAVCRSWVISR